MYTTIASLKNIVFILLLISASTVLAAAPPGKGATIKDEYIVVLKIAAFSSVARVNALGESVEQVAGRLIAKARQNQAALDAKKGLARPAANANTLNKLGLVYSHALQGFSATLTPEAVQLLRSAPEIDYIEPNGVVSINAVQTPTPSWGLDRIDQPGLPLNSAYVHNKDGANVHVYVLVSTATEN